MNHHVQVFNLFYYRSRRVNRRQEPLTQRELAHAADLCLAQYGLLERGRSGTTVQTRAKLARALGVSEAQLARPLEGRA